MADQEAKAASNPAAVGLLRMLRASPPSPTLDNVWEQARQDTGIVDLCARWIGTALGASTPQVMVKGDNAVRKALPAPGAQPSDHLWSADAEHPLLAALERPNRQDSWSDWMAQAALQYHLFGRWLYWCVPNASGAPTEFYTLPTAFCWPQPPTVEYPYGYWRLTQYVVSGSFGMYGSGTSAIIDGRDVYRVDRAHPVYRNLPYSHLTSFAQQVDLVQKFDKTNWSALDRSVRPDGILLAPGTDAASVKEIEAEIRGKYSGPEAAGGIFIIGGGDASSPFKLEPSGFPAKDSEYRQGWDQYVSFVVAAFGLHRVVLGLTATAGNFAEQHAARLGVLRDTLQPFANKVAQSLTNGPAARWDDPGKLRVQIDLPKPEDPQLQEQQITTDVGANAITVNELRALRNREPFPDGDCTPAEYAAKSQAAMQPAGVPGMGQPGQDVGGDAQPAGDEGDDNSPLTPDAVPDAVTQSVLAALGVPGGGNGDPGHPPRVMKAHADSPPWPGAVFDEQVHRWVNPQRKQGGKNAPLAAVGGGTAAGTSAAMYDAIHQSVSKTGDVPHPDRASGSVAAQLWDRVKAAGLHTVPHAADRFAAALQEGSTTGGKSSHYTAALNKHFAPVAGPASPQVTGTPTAPARGAAGKPPRMSDNPAASGPSGAMAIEGGVPQKPLPAQVANHPAVKQAQPKLQAAAKSIGQRVQADPAAAAMLAKAHAWADRMAEKNADRVAAHMGISRELAKHVLSGLIKKLCADALAGGGTASATFDPGTGKRVSLSVRRKPPGQSLPRPANPAGQGISPVRKAVDTADVLDVPARARKLARRILKGLE